jgi:thymidylate kinase
MGRLIFIEGFPGAGKSTTAQFLARLLARRGEARSAAAGPGSPGVARPGIYTRIAS